MAGWSDFRTAIRSAYLRDQYVVVRGLPLDGEGVAVLWALACVSDQLRSYRGDRVLKHFRMSPWTTALSHTLEEGHFHTDLNTAESPPAVTAILCTHDDPGGPPYGQLRIARLRDLRASFADPEHAGVAEFLTATTLTMVNDTSPTSWTGCAISRDVIRFHPETIRAAERRAGRDGTRFESELRDTKVLAMHVSVPIDLHPGDAVFVSNRRALHYRAACSVRFTRFPREFESRQVSVAHGMTEP